MCADNFLHGVHHVIVEHPVEHPHMHGIGRIGRDQGSGAGVVDLQVLDDRGGFEHNCFAIDQHRKLAERTGRGNEGTMLRVFGVEHPEFMRRVIGKQRNLRLPGVRRKRMAIERQHCRYPARAASIAAISIFFIVIIA